MKSPLLVTGVFGMIYCDPSGAVEWRRDIDNGATIVGCDRMLRRMFLGASPDAGSGWKIGIIAGSGFSSVAPGDTHGSHPGWTEFSGYSGGVRKNWSPFAATGGVMSGIGTQFDITSAGTVRGLLTASKAVIDLDPLAILWSTAVAISNLTVASGGVLHVTYTTRIRNP